MADETRGGPSSKAVEAAIAASRRGAGKWSDVIAATHDPFLGRDRSVCLRDVLEKLRAPTTGMDGVHYAYAADFIEQEFGLASLEQKED